MSARFGRNQRRALRAVRVELAAAYMATIVETTRRLVGCAPAPLGTPEVERWGIVEWSLSIDDDGGRVERNAYVVVRRPEALFAIVRNAGRVSFQGGLYHVASLEMVDRWDGRTINDAQAARIFLIGVGR